jgi:hypothetical protein
MNDTNPYEFDAEFCAAINGIAKNEEEEELLWDFLESGRI